MTGELHDFDYPNQEKEYIPRQKQAADTMTAALVWLGVYFLIIKPFKIYPASSASIELYVYTHTHKLYLYDLYRI